MDLKTCYDALGGSYQDVTDRLPSERLVRRLLLKFPEDPSFRDLGDALSSGDRETAFRSAHTLKGVCLNLGFTALLASASAMTEALRPGRDTDSARLLSLWEDVRRDHTRAVTAIGQLDA